MTGAARTDVITRAATDDLRIALEELGLAAADAGTDARTVAGLAAAVRALEAAAGAGLGAAGHDPVVVLQRRLARASRVLSTRPTAAVDLATVRAHAAALRSPAAAAGAAGPADRPAVSAATAAGAALVRC